MKKIKVIEVIRPRRHHVIAALGVFAVLCGVTALILALLLIPGPTGPAGPRGQQGRPGAPAWHHPQCHRGTIPPTNEPPANTYTLTASGSESLAAIARKTGVSVQDLVQNTTQLGGASNHGSFWKWYSASWGKKEKVPAGTVLFFESPSSAGKTAVR